MKTSKLLDTLCNLPSATETRRFTIFLFIWSWTFQLTVWELKQSALIANLKCSRLAMTGF